MPEGAELDYIVKQQLLTDEELLTLIQEVFIPVGFTRFRLTGGEPLLRPHVVDLVEKIAHLPQTEDLGMTTNGFLLAPIAQNLYDAGLKRINISLDSLDPHIFAEIVGNHGRGRWQQVWEGIQAAYRVGFNPLKLNVVVIPGVNDHEILDLAALTIDKQWHVRFIEFMPFHQNEWDISKVLGMEEIIKLLEQEYELKKLEDEYNDTDKKYRITGAKGNLGIISTITKPFCDGCNRLRLTADGKMKNCLFGTKELDLLAALRKGQNLEKLILESVSEKRQFTGGLNLMDESTNRSMIAIGG
jgi:cyclic pyranopterin phosphate synthase